MKKDENRYAPYFMTLGILFALSVSQLIYYYPALPDIMAQKYNFDGMPYKFASKNIAIGLMAVLAVLPIAILAMVYKLPLKANNIPNKDYWMRTENQPRFKKKLMKAMFQLCLAMSVMLMFISYAMIQQNLTGETMSSNVLIVTIGFSVFVPVWMIFLFSSFKKTD